LVFIQWSYRLGLSKADYSYINKWVNRLRAIKLLGGKCRKCKTTDVFVLTFHHTSFKDKNINYLQKFSWKVLENELKHCILLCENCHRDFHNHQNNTKMLNNKNICLEYKNIYSCQHCGYDKNISALEFHHDNEEDKNFGITEHANYRNVRFKTTECITGELKDELDDCTVICSNCHRREHINHDKFEYLQDLIYRKLSNDPVDKQIKVSRDVIKILINNGYSQKDITKILKCSKSTVSYAVRQIKQSSK